VLYEWTINDERISSPAVLLVSNVVIPETVFVIIEVDRCQQRRVDLLFRIRIRFKSEVGHDLFHLWLDLILSNIKLIFHDLSGFTVSTVLVEALGKSLHGIPLSFQFIVVIVDSLGQLGILTLRSDLFFLFGVGSQSELIDLIELQLIDHFFTTSYVHSKFV
jgi:hypothetical protein